MNTDVTHLIERLEAFEEQLGVSFEGLYAVIVEDNYIKVNGELILIKGSQLSQNIKIQLSAYDLIGRVIATTDHIVLKGRFLGLDTFSGYLECPSADISKIRIYPQIY
jgi:hypothetical protein